MPENKSFSECTIFLKHSPCCIAFAHRDPQLLAVGTYYLQDDDISESGPRRRRGSVELFRAIWNEKQKWFTHLCSLPIEAGVLDIRSYPDASCRFLIATSRGQIQVLRYQRVEVDTKTDLEQLHVDYTLHLHATYQVFSRNTVITSFALHPERQDQVITSSSDGSISIINLGQLSLHDPMSKAAQESPARTRELFCHDLEAWTAIFSSRPHSGKSWGVWSGGDDCALAWHEEEFLDDETPAAAAVADNERRDSSPRPAENSIYSSWRDVRIHGAGVTAILPLPGWFVATGSYDDKFRILSRPIPPSKRPIVVAELDLGGGVWKLSIIEEYASPTVDGAIGETYKAQILACCMYAGARVLHIETANYGKSWMVQVSTRFEEHQSMCYGGVTIPRGPASTSSERLIVTCSFYDHRLCLWRSLGVLP